MCLCIIYYIDCQCDKNYYYIKNIIKIKDIVKYVHTNLNNTSYLNHEFILS